MSVDEHLIQAQQKLAEGNLQEALSYFESATTVCLQQNLGIEKKLICLANIGACQLSLGRHKESLKYFQESLSLLPQVYASESTDNGHSIAPDGLQTKADLAFNLSTALLELEDYRQAGSTAKTAIDCYVKSGATDQAADAFVTLAKCQKHLQQSEAETQSLRSARQLYSEVGDADKEGIIVGELLLALHAQQNKVETEKCIGMAKLMALRMKDVKEKGHLLMKLGLVKASRRSFSEALEDLQGALPLVRTAAETEPEAVYYEASILQNIGAVYNELKRFQDSIVFHEEAAKLHASYGSKKAEAKCYCNKAVAESSLEQWSAAEETLEVALQRAIHEEDKSIQFQVYEGLGAVCFALEKTGKAREHLEAAVRCLEAIGGDIGLVRERVLEKLADVTEVEIAEKERTMNIHTEETDWPYGQDIDEIDGGYTEEEDDVFSPLTPYIQDALAFTLPPLITSTPLHAKGRQPRLLRGSTLPSLRSKGDDSKIGRSLDPSFLRNSPTYQLNVNIPGDSVAEVLVYDPETRTLASEDELGKTLKSINEVLTPKPHSSNQMFGLPVSQTNRPRSSQSSTPHDVQLQRAYLSTYAEETSAYSVSITPESFTEEDIDVGVSHGKDQHSLSLQAKGMNQTSSTQDSHNQTLLSKRVPEGSLAIGVNAREEFVAVPSSSDLKKGRHRKKGNKTYPKKEPIRPKNEAVEGQEQTDGIQTRSEQAHQSKYCVIL